MAVSLSALSTSLSSLSFSSHISQRPNTLSFATTLSLSRFPKTPSLVISATALAEPETEDLKKFVKSRLPGGFAAQTIIGTGRRKSAIARVVLQEGTGKFIINYRDAKCQHLLHNPGQTSPAENKNTKRMDFFVLTVGSFVGFQVPFISHNLYQASLEEYLQGNPLWLQYIKVPLITLGYESSYDVFVKAEGGGLSGQAQAISLGIARALLKVSEDHRAPLRQEGLLTRDSRVVERKKVGLKKARKAPQYSKR
ncbi:hypothetical protein V8G54_037344 [Vigna mungo]|uniref:30S ribosomal protein S9, chloroplastic n=1 Tax=Vigna mungo TaxID=3915 RepID=A0AAQ3MJ59_VIGMU